MKSRHIKGFSLIELLVAMIIVGILAAIAIPSYNNYMVRGSRAAAQTELLEMASLQEKIYLNSSAYSPNVSTAYNGTASGGLGKTNSTTSDGMYDLALSGVGQTYTLTATPVAGTRQEGNGCLTIRENGLRQWHENNDTCDTANPSEWK
ncbi:MAG TPA: type IV pilin protein [Gallionella sp.]|nr:type IV pilin protein [Gallionella sp.]